MTVALLGRLKLPFAHRGLWQDKDPVPPWEWGEVWELIERMRQLLLALTLVCVAVGSARAGLFQDAEEAYSRSDYATAMRLLRPLADQGDPQAQDLVGFMYWSGQGGPQNYAEAVKWYRKAAEQGLPNAQFNLGVTYDKGQGVPQDSAEAIKWYRKAAERGEPAAQFSVGIIYYQGQGVPKDDAEAANWHRKAAEQGEPAAQLALGIMYANGRGVPQDDVQAYKWISIAAARLPASDSKRLNLAVEKA